MVMVDICNNLILYTMYCLFCDMFCSLMYASSGLINKEFEFEFVCLYFAHIRVPPFSSRDLLIGVHDGIFTDAAFFCFLF